MPDTQTIPSATRAIAESAAASVEYQLRNCVINRWPFPHTLIRPVFPEPYYSQMTDAFPTDEVFTPLNEYHPERGAVFLTPDRDGSDDLGRLDEHARCFWNAFTEVFIGDRFRAALLECIGGPELAASHLHKTRGLIHLSLDRRGYQIRPHTDIAKKIVTVLFYLPAEEDLSAAPHGTCVLAERPGQQHRDPHDWDRYDSVFTAPFLSNSMFAFRVGDSSWHGVRPVDAPIRRRSIQYFVILDD